jgi:hypothetical protein
MLTPEQVREIRSLLYSECSKADYYDALSRLLDDRAEIAAAVIEITSNADLNRAVANALHPEPPASERRAIHESGVWRWARYHTPVTRNEWGRWEPADFCGDPVASYALEKKMLGFEWLLSQHSEGWSVSMYRKETRQGQGGHQYHGTSASRLVAMCLATLRALGVEFTLVEGWDAL